MSQPSQSSATSGVQAGKRQRTPGWWIPWIYFSGILLVAIVNGIMIYFAISTNTGLETENHFIKGIRYNSALEGQRAQDARGWKVGLDFVSPEVRQGRISLNLRDRDDNYLREAKISLRAVRPVAAGNDFDIEMAYLGESRFGGEAAFPLSGIWDLKLVVQHASGDYQEIKRIWVK